MELFFAILLAAGAAGLILGLGLAERQKMFAALKGLGADARQLGAFLWSEALFMLVPGIVIGGLLGLGVAQVLVKMLTGIFDPPPETLTIPWLYLAILCIAAVAAKTMPDSANADLALGCRRSAMRREHKPRRPCGKRECRVCSASDSDTLRGASRELWWAMAGISPGPRGPQSAGLFPA